VDVLECKCICPAFDVALAEGRRFRWLRCQLDELSPLRQNKAVRSALDELPKDLEKTYERILDRIDKRNRDIVARCLLWVSFPALPMTLEELRILIAIEHGLPDIDEDNLLSQAEDILNMCANLVVGSDVIGFTTLAHLSIKDYLLSPSILQTDARVFSLSRNRSPEELALYCLSYLSFAEFQKGPVLTHREWLERWNRYYVLDYTARAWPHYALLAGQPESLVFRIMQFFKAASGRVFMSWLQILNADMGWRSYPEWGHPLYYASSFGLDKVVEILIHEDHNPNSLNRRGSRYGGTAIHGAVLRQHTKVMKLLLEAKADPNIPDDNGVLPLHTAAIYGNQEAISMLLDYGAKVNAIYDNETACDWADRSAHPGTSSLLRSRGAKGGYDIIHSLSPKATDL
jgi:hypothetical protein